MNVEIETEAPIFLFWEYLFQIFSILSLQFILPAVNEHILERNGKIFFKYIFTQTAWEIALRIAHQKRKAYLKFLNI